MLKPYGKNPFYWERHGRPLLLVGGSVEDNLFQIPDLAAHLRLLADTGGNYIRCTMSSRDPGDVWPFERGENGLYDLNQPSREYWLRFERCLELCKELGIVMQIEVWDRFDFAREPWQANPFNPANNRNYSAAEARLDTDYPGHPSERQNPFFRTVPKLENNPVLLNYQRVFVDRILKRTLPYDHVLYCMDNETNESPEWGRYWAEYIKAEARNLGRSVFCTEMWDAHDINHSMHEATWRHPDLYGFCDISQNNHQSGENHYKNLIRFRTRLAMTNRPRPLNNVKIYGADSGRFGSDRDGTERFWRNVFAGCASVRFHRPPSGIGLSDLARTHIRAMRSFAERFPVHLSRVANERLSQREPNEAFCLIRPGQGSAVYLPAGGHVQLAVAPRDSYRVHWLDIARAEWRDPVKAALEKGLIDLSTPDPGGAWVAVVEEGSGTGR